MLIVAVELQIRWRRLISSRPWTNLRQSLLLASVPQLHPIPLNSLASKSCPRAFQGNYDDLPIMKAHILSVLHVCRLSRALARKTYKPCFSQIFKHPVYFDQTKDRLVFKSVEAFSIFREEEAKAYCWDMVSVVLAEPLHDISEISPDLEIPFSWFAWRLIWKYY
jgi:hypothetical protein